MRAAVLTGPREIAVETVPDPRAGADGIVVRIEATGICGSDMHAYAGALGEAGQILGHEFAGEVVEVGPAVDGIAVGDRVTGSPAVDCGQCVRCLEGYPLLCERQAGNVLGAGLPGSFAEYLRIPSARLGRSVFRLPDGVDWETGATAEPLGVGLHVAWLARPRPTETAVVLGLGPIGLATVQALKVEGIGRVIGIDVSPARLALAEQLGADVVVDASRESTLERLQELTGKGPRGYGGGPAGANADLVCECAGLPGTLQDALQIVRRGGRLVVVALFERLAEIDVNQLVIKELEVRGSFGYGAGGFTGFRDALELLAAGRVDTHPWVTHRFPLAAVAEAFRAQADRTHAVKVMLAPGA